MYNGEMLEKDTVLIGERAVILGFGVTGQAVARYLISKNKKISVFDSNPRSNFADSLIDGFPEVEFFFESNDFDATNFDIVVVSPGAHLDTPNIEKAFDNNIPVYNDITLFVKEWRGLGNKIVGVTGSNGKTTIVSMMYDVLKDIAPVVMGGNIGKSPLDLLASNEDGIDYEKGTWAILELSSYQLELFKQEEEYLDVCIISNLSSNHLDRYHGKMIEYARAKTRGINPDKTKVIITADDEGTQKNIIQLLQDKNVKHVDLVSMQTPLDQVSNSGVYIDSENSLVFMEDSFEKSTPSKIFENYDDRKLVGNHNLYNIALALDAIIRMDMDISEKIISKIRDFVPLEHRIELVKDISGVKYINDSKSTSPASTRSALETVSTGKNVILIIGGEDKDMSYKNLQDVFIDNVKEIILLQGSISKKIKDLAKESDITVTEVQDMSEAVKKTQEMADQGDVVLLSPASASFRDYKSFEERGEHFKELVNLI